MCESFYGFCCGAWESGCEELEDMFGGIPIGDLGASAAATGLMIHPDSGALPGPRRMQPHMTVPKAIANALADICQEAITWFHDPSHVFLGDPDVRTIPDEEARSRIAGYQMELDKELRRVRRLPPGLGGAKEPIGDDVLGYVLSDMPFARQRALVERWERVWTDWLAAHPGWKVTDEGFIPPTEEKKETADGS